MKRLIDATTLKGEFTGNFNGGYYTVAEIKALIDTAPTVGGWVSVKDRLPEETESMFARFHATEKWDRAMWKNESEAVLVCVRFPDGGRKVTIGRLHDGKWNTTVSKVLPHEVTHWMPLPEPPEEVSGDAV